MKEVRYQNQAAEVKQDARRREVGHFHIHSLKKLSARF